MMFMEADTCLPSGHYLWYCLSKVHNKYTFDNR